MPEVRVVLPPALLPLFPGCPGEQWVAAATVREALDVLETRFPGLRDRLCDSTPAIRRHINVFVDGSRAGLEDRLAEGAELVVLTAISGG